MHRLAQKAKPPRRSAVTNACSYSTSLTLLQKKHNIENSIDCINTHPYATDLIKESDDVPKMRLMDLACDSKGFPSVRWKGCPIVKAEEARRTAGSGS